MSIVIGLSLIGTEASESAREKALPPTSTDSWEAPSEQNHAAEPLKGSLELWKFRFIIGR
jgi:hypothetical protein